ncbi:hypothetical protein HK098_000952 [Nowakowskiella sp. JEL0407]|nr:hypothetical protein HK098_000952 [Nowakowskiella sp. JEL0407]
MSDAQLATVPLKAYFPNDTYYETIPVGQYIHAHSENVGYYVAGDPNAPNIIEMGVPYGGGGQDGVHIVCAQAAREFVANNPGYAAVVRWMGWGGVAGDPIFACNSTRSVKDKCPDILMLGTTQIAGRVKLGDIIPVSNYMDQWFVETGKFLKDDLRKGTYYDCEFLEEFCFFWFIILSFSDFLKDLWRAIPIISDIRVLSVNVTAFNQYNVALPPPLGTKYNNKLGGNWTWEALTDVVLELNSKTKDKTFTLLQDYQEGFKTLCMMMRSARVSMFNLTNEYDGGCGYNNPKFHTIYDNTFRRIYNAGAFSYCAFRPNTGLPMCADIPIRTRLAGIALLPIQWFFDYKRQAVDAGDQSEIKMAFVPGFTTFLGGSGLAITRISRNPDKAWRLMSYLFDSNNRYITQIGIATSSPPPYESLAILPEWNTPEWRTVLDALPAAVPEQWPEQTFPELNAVEGMEGDKFFLMSTMFNGTASKETGAEVCKGFVKAFAKPCKASDYSHSVGECSSQNTMAVEFKWNEPKLCVNKTMLGDVGVQLPDVYTFECPYVRTDSPVAMGITAFSVIGIVISLACSGVLVYFKETQTVKASSPLFTHLTLVGSIAIYISSIVQAGDPAIMSCTVSVWVFVFGFGLTFGSLFVKIFRIYRIFTNKSGRKLNLGTGALMIYLLIILLCETAVLLAYELAPPRPVIALLPKEIPGVGPIPLEKCSSPNSLASLAIVFLNLVLVGVTCVLAFLCRKVPPQYQEAKVIGIIIYAASFILVVIVPVLIYISGSGLVQAPFMLFGLAANFTTMTSMIIFCGTKAHTAYLESTGQITLSKTGTTTSSTGTGSEAATTAGQRKTKI